MDGASYIESLAHDVRHAVRSLRVSPAFTILAIATLAIGIGATTAIFSTVNATLLRPLPYTRADDLVAVRSRLTDGRVTTGLLSGVEINALRGLQTVVDGVGAVSGQPFEATLLRDRSTPVSVVINFVTDGFFDVIGPPLIHGRAFTHEEHLPAGRDAPNAAVLSYRTWTTLFNADPSIVGRTIRIAEAPVATSVVGVASAELDLPHGTDLWVNARVSPQDVAHGFEAFARLRPGVTISQLRAAGAVTMTDLGRTIPSDVGREYVMRPLIAALVGDLGPTLLIVLGATALLLLLACVNVTNLLLVRGMARTREVAVRTALGATRARILHRVLAESLVLSTVGTIVGVVLAWIAVRLLLLLGASSLPRLQTVPFDVRVLGFAVGTSFLSGLTMGIVPAWRLARPDIRSLLNESGRSATAGAGTSRAMSGLVVAEVALALALSAGAGWLVQSFARIRATDPGFKTSGRLVIDVRPTRRFQTAAEGAAWSDALLERVRAAAEGAVAGSTSTFPLSTDRDGSLNVELRSEPANPNRVNGGHIRFAGPGFFEALGVRVIAGRTFTPDDRQNTEPVVVVNRAFVRRFLGDRDPLTESMAYGYPTVDRRTMSRIIGVVDDMRYESLAREAEPTYYIALAQAAFPFVRQTLVVMTPTDASPVVIENIRDQLTRFEPQMLTTFSRASDIVSATLARQQIGMTLMVIFGATALALAGVGIYGVIAYAAAQRTGELATRIALGASQGQIFRMLMTAGGRLVAVGLLAGLAAAYTAGSLVASFVFEMRATDPIVLAIAGAVVAAMSAIATMMPAFKASRLSPVHALRPK
jgi:putative ABC transport system permease protein